MKEKVLVVDDDQAIRDMMNDVLGNDRFEVFLAEGAQDAMTVITEEHDLTCVFLDLKLFGSNGIELCRAIRKRSPLSILYAMTGWSGLFEIEECREAGFDDYFPKPVQQDTIFQAIDEAIKKRARWKAIRNRF